MKNILILSPDAPENCMGGLGTHIREVLKLVNTETYNVTALCQGAEEVSYQDDKVKVYGVDTAPVMGLPANGLTDTFFMQTRFVARFMELYQAGTIAKPDLIHICDWTTAVAGEEIARSTGAKPVFAVHLSINNYIKEVHPIFKINCETAQQIEFNACRIAHRVLQVTKAYSELFPFNFYKHKTVICPNGVDYASFGNIQPATLPGTRPVKVLFVGRIIEMKNPQMLWSIDIPDNVDLIFMGGNQGSNPQLISDLQGIAAKNEQVHYLGAKYGQEKINLMAAADLVVMPSAHEPFGLVALEALAAGQNGKTVLAASFVDGLGEFLTEESAINCGTTKQSIQAAVNRFLAMTDEEKSAMRQAGCVIAQAYSWQNCVASIANVWKSVLGIKDETPEAGETDGTDGETEAAGTVPELQTGNSVSDGAQAPAENTQETGGTEAANTGTQA